MSILLTSCHHPALVFCQPLRRFLEGLFALTVLTGRPQHLGRGTGPWPTHTTNIKSFEINQFTKREIFLIQFLHFHIFITGFAKRSQSCDATGVREKRENDVSRKLQVRRVGNPSLAKFL